jgi:molybdopterin synthase catalytic subunit
MSHEGKIQLRKGPFESEEARSLLETQGCGAVLFFDGVMKEVLADGTRVSQLDWDAYEEMALATLNDLRKQAITQFALRDLVLIHRLDRQYPGDLIMTLGVSSERRKGAIEAIAWYMDELKKVAPLWKKETLADQQERWIGEEPPPPKTE